MSDPPMAASSKASVASEATCNMLSLHAYYTFDLFTPLYVRKSEINN